MYTCYQLYTLYVCVYIYIYIEREREGEIVIGQVRFARLTKGGVGFVAVSFARSSLEAIHASVFSKIMVILVIMITITTTIVFILLIPVILIIMLISINIIMIIYPLFRFLEVPQSVGSRHAQAN